MLDGNPKVGHSLESYMTGAHSWRKQSILVGVSKQFKRPTQCQSGPADPPAPRPQNHTSATLEMSVKFSLKEGLQIEIMEMCVDLFHVDQLRPFVCLRVIALNRA